MQPLIWAAVFILTGVLFFIFRILHPSHNQPAQQSHTKNKPPPISPEILNNPDFELPEVKKGDEIVRHYAYTLSFSDKDKEPYWVAYTFRRSYLGGDLKRTNHFEPDPDVPTGSSTPDDYRYSGYDKGHMAPAADMKWDKKAMQESFYLSNVCPQDHKCNDGIWAELEKAVRYWVNDDSVEYIVTGPVLPSSNPAKIGADRVTVPAYLYKVIFTPYPYPKAIGFIIPNQPGTQSFWHYASSVNQVEKTTHIHFFPELPGTISAMVKDTFEIADWKSSQPF